jgi:hypothetical protein
VHRVSFYRLSKNTKYVQVGVRMQDITVVKGRYHIRIRLHLREPDQCCGSLYALLKGQPVSDVAMHVNSYIFDELDIGLDFDTQTKLTKALSNTFTEADYIYQLNVGGSYLT